MKSTQIPIWLTLFHLFSGCYQAQVITSPLVATKYGSLKGSVGETKGEGKTYFAYRGIPYAKPPIGDLRFEAPIPNDPWDGILDATKDKAVCTQTDFSIFAGSSNTSLVMGSEDCLFINVYTRNVKGSSTVMVWIHGGGFTSGSSEYSLFSPDYFLDKDVVFVSFNYRLGIFGFLSTEDMAAPGNYGLKDQVLALKWVKENINNFGGDPDKITIFGESAGAVSVSHMLQTNKTAGLYRGAIIQSGTTLSQWGLTRHAKDTTKAVALLLGIEVVISSSEEIVKRLKLIDYKRLKNAEAKVTAAGYIKNNPMHGLLFGIVKEPEHQGAILSDKSYQLLANGKFNKVPIIIGHNSLELGFNAELANLARAYIRVFTAANGLAPIDLSPSQLSRSLAGQLIINKYFNGHILSFSKEQLAILLSVDQFNRPTRKSVQLMAKHTKVYFYEFSYMGKLGNPKRTVNGVTHAEDLCYMYISSFCAPITPDPTDILTKNRFITMWTNFAKTLDPTSSDNQNVLQNVKWIPNTSSTNSNKLTYLNFNTTLKMDLNVDQENWIFYETYIYGQYGDPNYYDTY